MSRDRVRLYGTIAEAYGVVEVDDQNSGAYFFQGSINSINNFQCINLSKNGFKLISGNFYLLNVIYAGERYLYVRLEESMKMLIYDESNPKQVPLGEFPAYSPEDTEFFWSIFRSGRDLNWYQPRNFLNLFFDPSREMALKMRTIDPINGLKCFHNQITDRYIVHFSYYPWGISDNFRLKAKDEFNNCHWFYGDIGALAEIENSGISQENGTLSLGSHVLVDFVLQHRYTKIFRDLIQSIIDEKTKINYLRLDPRKRTEYVFKSENMYFMVETSRNGCAGWKLLFFDLIGNIKSIYPIHRAERERDGGTTRMCFFHSIKNQEIIVTVLRPHLPDIIIEKILGYIEKDMEGILFSPTCFNPGAMPTITLPGKHSEILEKINFNDSKVCLPNRIRKMLETNNKEARSPDFLEDFKLEIEAYDTSSSWKTCGEKAARKAVKRFGRQPLGLTYDD